MHSPPETAGLLLQLRLALNGGTLIKQREYFWRLAETCDRLGNMEEAEEHLKSLMDMDLTPEQKLEALCFLADVQVNPQMVHGWSLPLAARLLPLRASQCMQLGARFICGKGHTAYMLDSCMQQPMVCGLVRCAGVWHAAQCGTCRTAACAGTFVSPA